MKQWRKLKNNKKTMKTTKRLYRSKTNKIVGGVCGGFGEYLNIDPVLIRLILVLMFLCTGFGLIAYIIAWIIIPLEKTEEPLQKEEPKTE